MFWIKNKKKCIPYIPQFNYKKEGFKEVYIAWTCIPENDTFLTLSLSIS